MKKKLLFPHPDTPKNNRYDPLIQIPLKTEKPITHVDISLTKFGIEQKLQGEYVSREQGHIEIKVHEGSQDHYRIIPFKQTDVTQTKDLFRVHQITYSTTDSFINRN